VACMCKSREVVNLLTQRTFGNAALTAFSNVFLACCAGCSTGCCADHSQANTSHVVPTCVVLANVYHCADQLVLAAAASPVAHAAPVADIQLRVERSTHFDAGTCLLVLHKCQEVDYEDLKYQHASFVQWSQRSRAESAVSDVNFTCVSLQVVGACKTHRQSKPRLAAKVCAACCCGPLPCCLPLHKNAACKHCRSLWHCWLAAHLW
jgi:hypothetical protein